jgi:hypothetical protein
MGAGSIPTYMGLPASYTGLYGEFIFTSNHPGVVQFALCDGSVRAIQKGLTRPSAGYNNYIYATGMKDGVLIDWSQLGQ